MFGDNNRIFGNTITASQYDGLYVASQGNVIESNLVNANLGVGIGFAGASGTQNVYRTNTVRGNAGGAFAGQAGNGAVYAIVPQVRKQVSGQIAGMCGAYGNVGGIVFLTALVFVSPQAVFAIMGLTSLLAFLACRWLVEPTTVAAPLHLGDAARPVADISSPGLVGAR